LRLYLTDGRQLSVTVTLQDSMIGPILQLDGYGYVQGSCHG
jgi:hypothetical protein